MKRIAVLIGIVLLVAMVGIAQATAVLPGPGQDGHDYLQVGNPPGGASLFNGELVSISADQLQILNNSGGAVVGPDIWLILGIPLDPGTGTSIKANGFTAIADGTFTSGQLADMFSINAWGSQNYDNWKDAELALTGIDVGTTGFGIYVYDFSGVQLQDKELYDVLFSSDLAVGTFAVAVGDLNTTIGKDKEEVFATTPFTQTGFLKKVPEPSMLLLLGSGLLGLAFFGRKKFGK